MFLNNKCVYLWLFIVALGAAVCVGVAHAAEGLFPNPTVLAPPAQATKLPPFDFANLHGGALKSSEMKGKVIIIRFWATW
jgi:cytochrome oxidase Cu insertion factor (SCO1/SenC/PrrC family)